MSKSEAQQVWEDHYTERDRVWSGRANVRLVEVAEALPTGRALDLGCGEGGDAMWLAERGWHVTAVDISQTALDRAAADARARNVLERIDFQRHDLPHTFPEGAFDLVSAQFLHSMAELDRPRLLRMGADVVSAGGTLLIVDHASPPPRMAKSDHHHEFPSAEEVVGSLDLDEAEWERARMESVERQASGPDGQPATWVDNVIVLRRRAGS
ncbi:MAG TPA: class I SAM-dependent methyltransferase [Mycobacterium sp.]|nr:class I SAM-dependent methyltransferase [Mycobacterium sp.]